MWLGAENSGGADAALITAVWTFLGIVVTTLGTIAVQAYRSRKETTTSPAPPPSTDTALLMQLAREQGALVQRADDNDERDDVQDHELRDQREVLDAHHDRLRALERLHDRLRPGWRDGD